MLVLSRKARQSIMLGNDIEIVVKEIRGGRVSIGIEAPPEVHIMRGELERFEEPKAATNPT